MSAGNMKDARALYREQAELDRKRHLRLHESGEKPNGPPGINYYQAYPEHKPKE